MTAAACQPPNKPTRKELTLTTPKKSNTQLPNCLGMKVAADSTQLVRGMRLGSW